MLKIKNVYKEEVAPTQKFKPKLGDILDPKDSYKGNFFQIMLPIIQGN